MGTLLSFTLIVVVGAFVVTQLIIPLSQNEDILPFFKKGEDK